MSNTTGDDTLAFGITEQTPSIRFLVSLSDGRTVIQDERPKQRNAWARLAKWMKQKPEISITGLRLQGPGEVNIDMPSSQKGYFIGYKQEVVWRGPQNNYIGIGYYDGQKTSVIWYRQPRFDHTYSEERTVAQAGFFLIQNP